jgi:hypothetical protein
MHHLGARRCWMPGRNSGRGLHTGGWRRVVTWLRMDALWPQEAEARRCQPSHILCWVTPRTLAAQFRGIIPKSTSCKGRPWVPSLIYWQRERGRKRERWQSKQHLAKGLAKRCRHGIRLQSNSHHSPHTLQEDNRIARGSLKRFRGWANPFSRNFPDFFTLFLFFCFL